MMFAPGIITASSLPGSGLDFALRATILLSAALLAWRLVGRRRPLIGSAIGRGALLGLILLPAFACLIPSLSLPLLQAERPAFIAGPTTRDSDDLEAPVTPPDWELGADAASQTASTHRAGTVARPVALAVEPSGKRAFVDRTDSSSVAKDWFPGVAFAGVVTYAAVALAMLARLFGSLAVVARVRRSSVVVDDPTWIDALDRLKGRLGLRRPVVLARSTFVSVPAVVGEFRPMILLPASSEVVAPTEHAEAILLHELAHVRRGDYAWNLLLRVVQAAYWPHPLVWLLGKAVIDSRERACDAYCVHQLGGHSAYRSALLAMAETLARRPGPALGLAMAGRSKLARRVLEIEHGRRESRCLPRWPARMAVFALAIASTAMIAPARLTRAEPRTSPVPPPPLVVAQEPTKQLEPARPPAPGKTFRLRVVSAETGRPVPNADVRVWMGLRSDDFRKADADGRIDLRYATGPDDLHFGVDAWGDGYAMQRHNWGNDPKVPIPDEATIKLHPGESLGGLVQDEAGRPGRWGRGLPLEPQLQEE